MNVQDAFNHYGGVWPTLNNKYTNIVYRKVGIMDHWGFWDDTPLNESWDSVCTKVEFEAFKITTQVTPYTDVEKDIMDHLIKAYAGLCTLVVTHPSHVKDFADGIHKCQDVIIHRIVQRDYPITFPTYEVKN